MVVSFPFLHHENQPQDNRVHHGGTQRLRNHSVRVGTRRSSAAYPLAAWYPLADPAKRLEQIP